MNRKGYKLFVFLILCGLGLETQAQKVSYDITVGWVYSRPKGMEAMNGFSLGAKADWLAFGAESPLSLTTGISLVSKGWKTDVLIMEEGRNRDWTCRLYGLEIPLHLSYGCDLGANKVFMGSVGPYVGVGLWGKSEGVETVECNPFKDGKCKRFDCGLGADVALVFRRVGLGVGYKWGLLRQTSGWKGLGALRNRALTVSLGYRL